ncbi:MAG: hypothetical protein QOC87_2053 [Actinomycetota bacterium]|nr:hypothetical protein [Actinomycetota bacterium]
MHPNNPSVRRAHDYEYQERAAVTDWPGPDANCTSPLFVVYPLGDADRHDSEPVRQPSSCVWRSARPCSERM